VLRKPQPKQVQFAERACHTDPISYRMLVLNLALAAEDCPVITIIIDVHQLHKVYAGLPSVPVDRRKGTHLRDRHATRPLCVHLPHSLLMPVLATSELL
jgi:hypothetical protein